jgi:hypothetical protein
MRGVPLARTARFRLATSRVLDRTVHAAPPLEARAWRSARRYVGGRTADEALAVAAACMPPAWRRASTSSASG